MFTNRKVSHKSQRLTLDKGAAAQTQKPQKDSDLKRSRIVRRAALEFKVTKVSMCHILEETEEISFWLHEIFASILVIGKLQKFRKIQL